MGAFDLAAQWMKWNNLFHCEINPFCQRILKYYWPEAKLYADIKQTDFSIWRGRIDILTGGFPCQPYSTAGKRKGKEDERHLWPEMLRAIQEIQPRWVCGENVLGLLNWNGGMVFDDVCADLEAAGYYNTITPQGKRKVFPIVLPACGVNAPHQRYRIFFIAHTECVGQQGQGRTERCGYKEARNARQASGTFDDGKWKSKSPLRDGNDGLPDKLDGITISDWRQESLKAGGNAVVPQLVYEIFKSIQLYETVK
jgi:DNA (cytosine-5)-methyltransferase 1